MKKIALTLALMGLILGICISSSSLAQGTDGLTRDQWLKRNGEIFTRFDKNSDGVLDTEELEDFFEELDGDGDGMIGPSEAPWPRFDGDRDGWIDIKEFLSNAPISREEFLRRRVDTFEEFDQDDDDSLQPNEFPVRKFQLFKF